MQKLMKGRIAQINQYWILLSSKAIIQCETSFNVTDNQVLITGQQDVPLCSVSHFTGLMFIVCPDFITFPLIAFLC